MFNKYILIELHADLTQTVEGFFSNVEQAKKHAAGNEMKVFHIYELASPTDYGNYKK